ncbi:MAG TPA: protein kinase [Gemmataceae bacterium]
MSIERDHHPSREQLAAFDAGQLTATERAAIELHVAACPRCGRELDTLPEDPFVALVRASAASTLDTPIAAAIDQDTPEPVHFAIPAALSRHPRYRVLEVIGAGGMGVVYKAVHRLMDRVVALKVLHRRFTEHSDFVERFRREVQAVARLSHPHIAVAHDAEQVGELHFFVMEHVSGMSLDRLVARRGPLPIAEACAYVRQAALGLQHAFEHGLVHRDVKPANLMRTPEGQIKVLDFGLAHLVRASDETPSLPSGAFVGTPDYTAPEQARDPRSADIRADVYGLGCTLRFLLTGQPLFPGGTALQKLLAHQDRPPVPLHKLRHDVPAALSAVLERMLAKEPSRRPATPAEVARALAPFTGVAEEASGNHTATPPRRPRWPWLVAAVLLVTGGVAGLLAWSATRPKPSLPDAPPDAAIVPPPVPVDPLAVATPEQMARLRNERRDQALDWLRTNNRWKPEAPIVHNTATKFAQYPNQIDGFLLQLGPHLLSSRQGVLLAGDLGGFFVFPLNADQAAALEIEAGASRFWALRKIAKPRRAVPRVRLSDLKIEQAQQLNFDARAPGTIAYDVVGPAIASRFAVRLSMRLQDGRRHSLLVWFKERTLEGRGILDFVCPPLASSTIRPRSPLVVFADICTNADGPFVVESNTAAILVESAP